MRGASAPGLPDWNADFTGTTVMQHLRTVGLLAARRVSAKHGRPPDR